MKTHGLGTRHGGTCNEQSELITSDGSEDFNAYYRDVDYNIKVVTLTFIGVIRTMGMEVTTWNWTFTILYMDQVSWNI